MVGFAKRVPLSQKRYQLSSIEHSMSNGIGNPGFLAAFQGLT
jgi:hypothetical protein